MVFGVGLFGHKAKFSKLRLIESSRIYRKLLRYIPDPEPSSPDSTTTNNPLEHPFILPSCHGLECSAVVFGVGLFGYKAKFPKSKTVIRSVLSSTTNPTWFSSAKPSRFHEIFLLVISIDVFSRPVMVLSVLLWSLVLVYSDTKQNFQNCD